MDLLLPISRAFAQSNELPTGALDVILVPGLFLFLAVFVYGIAFASGYRLAKLPKYRWIALGLLVLAIVFGWQNVWAMINPNTGQIYQMAVRGKKLVLAHYAGLILPILALLAFIGSEMWFKRYAADQE